MMSLRNLLFVPALLGLGASACHHSKPPKVTRLESHTQTDLSGRWNDTDAHLTSEALIYECFTAGWLREFADKTGRKPAVRVASVVNQTDEHIDAHLFIVNFERAMINSGKVQVLAQAGSEQRAIDAEQARARAAAPGAVVQAPTELAADYVVTVRMGSVLDDIEGKAAKLYKINFELIDPATGQKVWIGDHEVKKLVLRPQWAP